MTGTAIPLAARPAPEISSAIRPKCPRPRGVTSRSSAPTAGASPATSPARLTPGLGARRGQYRPPCTPITNTPSLQRPRPAYTGRVARIIACPHVGRHGRGSSTVHADEPARPPTASARPACTASALALPPDPSRTPRPPPALASHRHDADLHGPEASGHRGGARLSKMGKGTKDTAGTPTKTAPGTKGHIGVARVGPARVTSAVRYPHRRGDQRRVRLRLGEHDGHRRTLRHRHRRTGPPSLLPRRHPRPRRASLAEPLRGPPPSPPRHLVEHRLVEERLGAQREYHQRSDVIPPGSNTRRDRPLATSGCAVNWDRPAASLGSTSPKSRPSPTSKAAGSTVGRARPPRRLGRSASVLEVAAGTRSRPGEASPSPLPRQAVASRAIVAAAAARATGAEAVDLEHRRDRRATLRAPYGR